MLATELASRAALAVDNATLFSREREARAKAEEAVARLRDLEVISEAALTHLDLDRLLQDLLDGVRTVMRADTAVCLLLDETGDELVASWARGLEEEVEAARANPGRRRLRRTRRRDARAGLHPGRQDEPRSSTRC